MIAMTNELTQCFECSEYSADTEWVTMFETEDDGFDVILCGCCIERRANGQFPYPFTQLMTP